MKLIATLGATLPKHQHNYQIDNKTFNENFSFEALKKFYQIDDKDVVIIGTSKTKEI